MRLPALLGVVLAVGLPVDVASQSLPPSRSSAGPVLPKFLDISQRSGVSFRHWASHTGEKYLIETMGAGVALLDFDRDGLLDMFFVNGAGLDDPMTPGKLPDKAKSRFWNRLYRNNGDLRFADVTESAGVAGRGYGMGVAVGDYDNDGYPDLYVTNLRRNILYHNDRDGTFSDVTEQAGVAGVGWSAGAAFLDYDRDGRLDLIVARYLDWDFEKNIWCGERSAGYRSYCHPRRFKPVTHLLYHNDGQGTFRDVSAESGLADAPGKGLGVAIHDFDGDGWVDIFVANDEVPQQLFRNRRDGTFEEVAVSAGLAYDEDGAVYAGMGVDFADYNNDGQADVFVNALARQRYALYRAEKGAFQYVTGPSGLGAISETHSGWGTRLFDYDNDGWKDLFVAQGHVMDNIEITEPDLRYLEPFLLLRNVFGRFFDVSKVSGAAYEIPRAGRGAAVGDLDNDGFLDIVVSCNDQPAVVLRNQGGNGNHWLTVDTVGTVSNRDGIGARIRVVTESGAEQYVVVSTAGSYLSASDKRVHFGLGSDTVVRALEITWPSGIQQTREGIPADQVLEVREPPRTKAGLPGSRARRATP